RVGPLIDSTIALLEQGLAVKMTPTKVAFRDVSDQVKAQIFDDPMKSPMLDSFWKIPQAIPEADRTKLKDRATKGYKEAVLPALTKLHDFLVMRYLPGCRDTTDAASLPNGPALYAYNVKWHTTTNKTPQEIHEIGLAE